jgi:hypothetical protein
MDGVKEKEMAKRRESSRDDCGSFVVFNEKGECKEWL